MWQYANDATENSIRSQQHVVYHTIMVTTGYTATFRGREIITAPTVDAIMASWLGWINVCRRLTATFM